MRAVTYSRVSTEEQADNTSITTQLEAIHKYASEHEMEVVKDCIDAGITGATLDRAELNELRELVKIGQVDAVIVYDPDRLSRNFAHLMVLASEFDRARVELAFVTETMEKSPEGRMLFGMKGLFAEYERTKIMERTARGRMQTAKEGRQPGGKPIYGYKLVDGKHIISEKEAQVIRMIFEGLSNDGFTLTKVQSRLNKMGIPPRNGGKFWYRGVLQRIVRNEAYVGRWYYNKRVEVHQNGKTARVQRFKSKEHWILVSIPAIISEETFEAAQRQLKRNADFSPRNTKREYLLSGLLVCDKCGRNYSARTMKNNKTYYGCNSKMKHLTPVVCKALYIKGEIIEPLVWDAVTELLSQPTLIVEQIEKQNQSGRNGYFEGSLETVKQTLEKKSLEVDRLLEAYKIGAIDSQLLKREMDKVKAEQDKLLETKQDLEKQLQEAETHEISADYIERFCKNISAVIDNLSFEDKRAILREVIDKIVVNGSEVSIYGIIPMLEEDSIDKQEVLIESQSC